MKPRNPNDALDAEHVLYAGTTGSGKSTAVQKMGRIKPTDQVLFWDPYGQYLNKLFLGRQVRTYDNLKDFFNAAYAGRKTSQGFKIALTPREDLKNKKRRREVFLQACEIMWSLGDGLHSKKLHCYFEEINRVTTTTGDEDSIYGEILEAGRKFGLVAHSVSQRLQPIPNTVISMSPYKWVGVQEAVGDVNRVAKEIGVLEKELAAMRVTKTKTHKFLPYFFKHPGIGNVKPGQFKFERTD